MGEVRPQDSPSGETWVRTEKSIMAASTPNGVGGLPGWTGKTMKTITAPNGAGGLPAWTGRIYSLAAQMGGDRKNTQLGPKWGDKHKNIAWPPKWAVTGK